MLDVWKILFDFLFIIIFTVIMSQEESERTVKDIFILLQENIHAYMKSSDQQTEQLIQIKSRRARRSRTVKASSCPVGESDFYHVQDQATSTSPTDTPTTEPFIHHQSYCDIEQQTDGIYENKYKDAKISCDIQTKNFNRRQNHAANKHDFNCRNIPLNYTCPSRSDTESSMEMLLKTNLLQEQSLLIMRENVELKVQMQEIYKHLKCIKIENDDNCSQQLVRINEILSNVICVQKRSELLCDKLCEGLDGMKLSKCRLTPELRDFCDRIGKTVGQDYRKIGLELGLEPNILDKISAEYSDEEDCLHQVVLEWSRREESPSYHTLISACHRVNPDILNSKPLSNDKLKILEQNYKMLCEEMLDIPVLPHLVTSGVMTLRLQKYVLQPATSEQRIRRLVSVLCTRENGFEEFCSALDVSEQHHVSRILKDALVKKNSDLSSQQDQLLVERQSSECTTQEVTQLYLRPCNRTAEQHSTNKFVRDPISILIQISDMINQLGIPPK